MCAQAMADRCTTHIVQVASHGVHRDTEGSWNVGGRRVADSFPGPADPLHAAVASDFCYTTPFTGTRHCGKDLNTYGITAFPIVMLDHPFDFSELNLCSKARTTPSPHPAPHPSPPSPSDAKVLSTSGAVSGAIGGGIGGLVVLLGVLAHAQYNKRCVQLAKHTAQVTRPPCSRGEPVPGAPTRHGADLSLTGEGRADGI